MRLTIQKMRVLNSMLDDAQGRHYGFDLARRAQLKPSALYPILKRLEEEKFATSDWEEQAPEDLGRPRRRYYRLTPKGVDFAQNALAEHVASLNHAPSPPRRKPVANPSPGWA
jgi:PadR family transcriptional regulator PadR